MDASGRRRGRALWLVRLQIVLILVWSGGAGANSDDGKASLSLEGADAGDKDVYLTHSCIHDEILHQRRRAGRKEYSVMPQVYHMPRKKVERVRGRQLLGLSSWRAPRSNVKKPIRIYLNYDAVGHSPDRDCKNVGDIVKLGEPPVPSAPGTPICSPHGDPPLVGDCWYNCTFEDIAGEDKKQRLRKALGQTVEWFRKALAVEPVKGNLRLSGYSACGQDGGVQLPHAYIEDGVANADLVLLVTTRPTTGNTLAWAVACERDQWGRAIAGHVNVAPRHLTAEAETLLSATLIHEVMHVLGFDPHAFTHFRDERKRRRDQETHRLCGQSIPSLHSIMVSAKRYASVPLHYRRRPRLPRRPSSPSSAAAAMPDAGDLPHPHAALWSQANAIQNIKSLIPVTLDLKASNFTKWRQFLNIAVTQYALADHLDAVPPPADEEWQRMDSTVLRWLYGSVAPDISDMVMAAGTTASAVLGAITALFRDNQQARAGYLGQKFRNIEQLDKSVTAYCLEQKTVADALADVNAPVSDDALVWNTIKGLNDHYKDIGNLAPLLTPFPTFLQFRNMLLLQELKPSNTSSSSPAAFYTAPPAGGPRGSPAPSLQQPQQPHAGRSGFGAPSGNGSGRNKGKKKNNGGHGAPAFPSMQHPWTGAIYMHPMMGHGSHTAGILGSRPAAPPPRPAHGYMALPAPSYAPPSPATFTYSGYPNYGSPSTPTWDPSALASYFNTMSLQAPTEWVMDTGASAHMSSDAGQGP